jgi:hypothetical protein
MTTAPTAAIPRLVADCGGCITALAMTIPRRLLVPEQMPKATALGNLAQSMPNGTTLHLMTDDPAHPDFVAWRLRHPLADEPVVLGAGADAPILESEIWSQDPWMVADRDGALHLYWQRDTDRPGRQAKWVAESRGIALERPQLQLAGGNTLTGPDFRILGAASVEMTRSSGDLRLSWAEALARHQALDPRPISIFGFALPHPSGERTDLWQQPSHLDLVLSVTGIAPPDGRPLLLLADPRSGDTLDAPRTPGWAEQLDWTARHLEAAGFAVRRNPVPYVRHPQFSPNPTLRAYNNILLENDPRRGRSRPRVWLPAFADLEPNLEGFDQANHALWSELGFDPVSVFGYSALARAGGGIRCASKVLQRNSIALG